MPIGTMVTLSRMHKEGLIITQEMMDVEKTEIAQNLDVVKQAASKRSDEVKQHADDKVAVVAAQAAKNAVDVASLREESFGRIDTGLRGLQEQLSEVIEVVRSSLESRLETLEAVQTARCDSLTSDLGRLRFEFDNLTDVVTANRTELASEFQRDLSKKIGAQATEQANSVAKLERKLVDWKQSIKDEEEATRKQREAKGDADMMERMKKMMAEKISEMAGSVMSETNQHLLRHDHEIKSVEETLNTEIVEHGKKTDIELARVRDDTSRRLIVAENETAEVKKVVTSASSAMTRTIDWVIPDLLRQLTGSTQSWFSPKFAACGEVGLQLELQVSLRVPLVEGTTEVLPRPLENARGRDRGRGDDRKGRTEPEPEKPVFEARLNLWAGSTLVSGDGITMAFRLSISGMYGPAQENKFEKWAPCPAGRTWRLDDRLNRDEGNVRICAEFLASRTSTQLHAARESAAHLAQPERPVTAPALADKAADPPQQLAELIMPYAGIVSVHRQVDNRQDERMKSCMVRRIEWRLDQASGLKTIFPKGECLYSTSFSAAGMEGLQLLFYPMGCASAPQGYCSFFLKCPETVPRVWLQLGKHRMEALSEDSQPGCVGRAKCWHYDKAVDNDTDALMLLLEVQEAPCESIHVNCANDPRRFVKAKTFAEVRPPSSARPRSSSNKPGKRRPPPPTSDSNLTKGADTTKWMTQAYADASQGYSSGAQTARQPSSDRDRMPPLTKTPSPPLGMQAFFAATAPISA